MIIPKIQVNPEKLAEWNIIPFLEIPRGPRGIDAFFLDPRGMVNCRSSIPRFLDSSRSKNLRGIAIPRLINNLKNIWASLPINRINGTFHKWMKNISALKRIRIHLVMLSILCKNRNVDMLISGSSHISFFWQDT